MENIIIDTYAWVEYFNGSKKGERLRGFFKKEEASLYTVECCLAEIKTWCLREEKDFEQIYQAIKANSIVIPVFTNDWLDAAEERFKIKNSGGNFGLIDALQVAKQKRLKAKIITGDKHFKTLKNIIFIGD